MIRQLLISSFITLFAVATLFAQKNSQWRGPDRTGIYPEKNLLKEWPADGPELLWHFDELGEGHSSAAVTEDMIYTAGMLEENAYIFAFNHKGELLWKKEVGIEWSENFNGARSTPTIYDGKLYYLTAFVKLVCLDAKSGDEIWSKDLMKDYGARNIQWGVTETMVIDGDKIICSPGGEKHNIMAFNRNTGEVIWTSEGNKEKSAYCSPLIIQLESKKILVNMFAKNIVGVDVETGKLLWTHPQTNKWSVHANTPYYHDGNIFCMSGYGTGGVMLDLSKDGNSVKELWRDSTMDGRMGGVLYHEGYIYSSGHKSRAWHCLDWKTGEVKYSTKKHGFGNIIFADGMIYGYSEKGEILLVKPNPEKFDLVSKFKVPYGEAQHWAHSVINNGILYVRHGNSLMAYNIKKK